uniref:Mothers against decapentaplegic homolog n=1 Tax=Chelydra serpentina TaxID=8475 RepID=A0A8C3TBQ8_CHESE
MFRSRRAGLVRRLWRHRCGAPGPEDGPGALKPAAHALFRKLKDEELELLVQAVESRGAGQSGCVWVARGELRGSKQGLPPQVLICRLYRWPDLRHPHELKRLTCCQSFGGCGEGAALCCNPHHLSRLAVPGEWGGGPSPTARRHHSELGGSVGRAGAPPPRGGSCPTGSCSPVSALVWFPFRDATPPLLQNLPLQLPMDGDVGAPQLQPPGVWLQRPWRLARYGEDQGQGVPVGTGVHPGNVTPRPRRRASGGTSTARLQPWVSGGSCCHLPPDGPLGGAMEKPPAQEPAAPGVGQVPPVSRGAGHPLSLLALGGSGFSLGQLQAERRSAAVRRARSKIGRGLLLSRERDGVWAYNRSEHPIFASSPTLGPPGARGPPVRKVLPGYSLQVFDYERAGGQAGWRRPGDGPCDPNSIRISFAKGWGPCYSRQFITACPCWLEILLTKPR